MVRPHSLAMTPHAATHRNPVCLNQLNCNGALLAFTAACLARISPAASSSTAPEMHPLMIKDHLSPRLARITRVVFAHMRPPRPEPADARPRARERWVSNQWARMGVPAVVVCISAKRSHRSGSRTRPRPRPNMTA